MCQQFVLFHLKISQKIQRDHLKEWNWKLRKKELLLKVIIILAIILNIKKCDLLKVHAYGCSHIRNQETIHSIRHYMHSILSLKMASFSHSELYQTYFVKFDFLKIMTVVNHKIGAYRTNNPSFFHAIIECYFLEGSNNYLKNSSSN